MAADALWARAAPPVCVHRLSVPQAATLGHLAYALSGLTASGVAPGRSFLEAVSRRLTRLNSRGQHAIRDGNARAVSTMMLALAKAAQLLAAGGGAGGQAPASSAAAVVAMLPEGMWPVLMAAADEKLRAALGEEQLEEEKVAPGPEPSGAGEGAGGEAAEAGWQRGGGGGGGGDDTADGEVQGALPQASLATICRRVAACHVCWPGVVPCRRRCGMPRLPLTMYMCRHTARLALQGSGLQGCGIVGSLARIHKHAKPGAGMHSQTSPAHSAYTQVAKARQGAAHGAPFATPRARIQHY